MNSSAGIVKHHFNAISKFMGLENRQIFFGLSFFMFVVVSSSNPACIPFFGLPA
jgi:hypothetical protein